MKKFIILALALAFNGISKAQFGPASPKLDSFINSIELSKPESPVISLNKDEFKQHKDSLMKAGVRFFLRRLDNLGNLVNEVEVNKFSLPNDRLGNVRYVFNNEENGLIEEIFIEGRSYKE